MKTLLIDGDGFIYRCGFAVEKTKYLVDTLWRDRGPHSASDTVNVHYFDNHKEAKAFFEGDPTSQNVWSRKELEPVENALALVKGAIDSLPEGNREVWLSPSMGNFREKIATYAKYKGNRDYAKRPTYYKEILEYLTRHYNANTTEGQEADDELGIRAGEQADSVIVSFDKDLDQIPGMHYNWVDKELYEITPKQGNLFFYQQVLSGDPTDNVPGCEGIGKAKAAKALEGVRNPREAWERVLEVYKSQYGLHGEARALETARLVYVRRKRDEIWSPPV